MFTKIKLGVPTYYVGKTTPGIMPDLRPREFDSLLEAVSMSQAARYLLIYTNTTCFIGWSEYQ
ncbi:MAG: hypothetical protein ABGY96_06365 [bacterium]|nr:hypothetical protein [Gammaproteobacteria bacterium]HIL94782.1 hypothetical protein [Pseudomonadales bacterium]